MAPRLRLEWVIILLMIALSVNANKVVVFGTVKFSNGVVAANYPLIIQPDTTICQVSKSILTNQNGNFETSLDCDNPILKTIVGYLDCDHQLVQVVKEVPGNLQVQYNITLCTPTNCHADFAFAFSSITPLTLQFNSNHSTASGPSPDEIISRVWSWGDGSPLTDGNKVEPSHTYPHDGTYNVCLKIITRNGCYSYSCKNVTVNSLDTCKASFRWVRGASNNRLFYFIDSSNAAGSDSIFSRFWFWGDGTSTIEGNLKNPTHTFPKDSTYNVCLKITTKGGCISYSCQKITAGATTECKANYGWLHSTSNTGREFHFTDSSKTAAGDSITSRRWAWGDGTVTENNINPTHTFPKDSAYNVCLRISTRNGCVSYSCQKVIVTSTTTECKANYGWIRGASNNRLFYFIDSSKAAGSDSIFSRFWFWGDGTSTIEGNLKNPTHTFPKDSTYNVCLKITTREGCISYSCQKITAGATTECKANYGWLHSTSNIGREFHFSDSSKTAAGDSITSRRWAWGDGTVTENIINPTHTFPKDSTYNVCLRITTRNGCVSYSCQKVMVGPNTECKAKYGWIRGASNNRLFYFIDSSKTTAGDSIISRWWIWNDGTITDGNLKNPTHTFPKDSTYNVCLKITTRSGCISYSCQKITAGATTECKANYGWLHSTSNTGREFHFTDSSRTAAGDSIIGRIWAWGDGTKTDGNSKSPVHTFPKDSTYNVCLRITTRNGCVSYSCQKVMVTTTTTECKANYQWVHSTSNSSNTRLFYFIDSSKTTAGDSIVSRWWVWNDGTITDGNLKNPTHTFPKDSTYNVCLKITTRGGCISYSCQKITAGATTECKANYGWLHSTSNTGREFHFTDSSKTAAGDSITSRRWAWGDGTVTENIINPTHTFPKDSTYNVCLRITTRNGCVSYSCQKVMVTTTTTECKANYRWVHSTSNSSNTRLFYFIDSSKTTAGDSIVSRWWVWNDGTITDGNLKNPTHTFPKDSTYNVCLKITTRGGCISYSCQEINVTSNSTGGSCIAYYYYEPIPVNEQGAFGVRFNSTASTAAGGDSIIHRYWHFGDGSSMDGNVIKPYHLYLQNGQYEVCLVIVTRLGCEKKICRLITQVTTGIKCQASFNFENSGNQQIRFNSGSSYHQLQGDSIIKHNWYFGDGTSLFGNTIAPAHEYKLPGTYTTCLTVITQSGCESRVCNQVRVEGQVAIPDSSEFTILTLYPNPVKDYLYVSTWSKHMNVPTELAIYDINGIKRWSRQIILPQGNSTWTVPTGSLLPGSYIITLTNSYGIIHKNFLKIN